MKKFLCMGLLLFCGSAWGTQNATFFICYFDHLKSGWQVGLHGFSKTLNLPKGEASLLAGTWTGGKPIGPEYAVCSMAIGTEDDNEVLSSWYKFEAKEFEPFQGKTCEDFAGVNMKLVSLETKPLRRGEFSEIESDWLPPEPDRMSVRIYFPTLDEMARPDELLHNKCDKLLPTN